ncbi:hypothetical protein SAMN05216232_3933 [Virgibacillus subterraneus]|uniref:DUF1617 family protein n=1 Tax=Virgibacillus subterraneus TaxID=621109 RepID=A0A1H9KMT2_9BACI|nr:hypothetical protein [Virgibacillus subterraneus]SER00402.1 hypothetical protein SAMN05216232_3933 [Virgibacillus subterraneus]
MKLTVENVKLIPTINLLSELSLKGKESRHRSKIINELKGRAQEVTEQEAELIKEHSYLDDEGNPKKTDDGKGYNIKDMDAFVKDTNELYSEVFVLEGGNFTDPLKTIKQVLLNSDKEWKGQEAEIYDYLCEQLEQEDNDEA